jgi:hypothetical protein
MVVPSAPSQSFNSSTTCKCFACKLQVSCSRFERTRLQPVQWAKRKLRVASQGLRSSAVLPFVYGGHQSSEPCNRVELLHLV